MFSMQTQQIKNLLLFSFSVSMLFSGLCLITVLSGCNSDEIAYSHEDAMDDAMNEMLEKQDELATKIEELESENSDLAAKIDDLETEMIFK